MHPASLPGLPSSVRCQRGGLKTAWECQVTDDLSLPPKVPDQQSQNPQRESSATPGPGISQHTILKHQISLGRGHFKLSVQVKTDTAVINPKCSEAVYEHGHTGLYSNLHGLGWRERVGWDPVLPSSLLLSASAHEVQLLWVGC